MPEQNEARMSYHAKRREEVDMKVKGAVLDELRSKAHPLEVTVEGVALRSGIAKTTIYRRYDNSLAMVATALFGSDYKAISARISNAISHGLTTGKDAQRLADSPANALGIGGQIMRYGSTTVAIIALMVEKEEQCR